MSNFGNWEGVIETTSASHDEKYLNIPTLNFARAKYTSEYVEFIGRETTDRNFEPLQELDEKDYEILDTFNPDQIIPFLLINGEFMQVGSGYSPQILEGLDHEKVRFELENPASGIGKAMQTEIDCITALVCKSIGSKAGVCNLDNIRSTTAKI